MNEKSKVKYLFVGRHNNDIDFMVPIVNRLAQDENALIYYFLSSFDLNIHSDYRLQHINRYPNVIIIPFWQLTPKTPITHFLSFLLKRTKIPQPLFNIACIFLRKVTESEWQKCIATHLEKINPQKIIFDNTDPEKINHRRPPFYIHQMIYNWGRERKIPFFNLPHGLLLFSPDTPTKWSYLEKYYNLTFVESDERKKLIESVSHAKVASCGAPRYDVNWMEILPEILPSENSLSPPPPSKQITLVFFATKLVYNYDFNNLLDWLALVSKYDNLKLIVQPHPRGQKAKAFKKISNLPSVYIDTTTPAPVLIRQSTIVSTLVSSVVIDALCIGKPILYPKFLHNKTTTLEKENVCFSLESKKETFKALDALVKGWQPESKDLDLFLKNHVYGGHQDAQIADRIIHKINNTSGHSS